MSGSFIARLTREGDVDGVVDLFTEDARIRQLTLNPDQRVQSWDSHTANPLTAASVRLRVSGRRAADIGIGRQHLRAV